MKMGNVAVTIYDEIIPKIERHGTLQDNLYNIIRRLVVEAKIEPGERINIEAISKSLGVSRTPVREVLNRLQSESLVRFVPRVGPVVEEISLKEIRDAYDIRLVLEGLSLRQIVKNIKDKDCRKLERIIAETRKMITKGQCVKIAELNEQFHFTIYGVATNSLLQKYMKDIFTKIERCTNLLSSEDRFVMNATEDHELIIASLKNRDLTGANRAIKKHINFSYKNLSRIMETRYISWLKNNKDGQN